MSHTVEDGSDTNVLEPLRRAPGKMSTPLMSRLFVLDERKEVVYGVLRTTWTVTAVGPVR